MVTRYVQMTLENGDKIFVREKDFRKLKKAIIEGKNPKKIVGASLQVMMNSPEGMTKLANMMNVVYTVLGSGMNVETLESLRDLIDHQIKLKKKGKKKNANKKSRTTEKITKRT